MEVVNATCENIEIFSRVLKDAAVWLNSVNQPMWKYADITSAALMKQYRVEDMKLCYEQGSLIGVYVLQWHDPLFWASSPENEAGILHKVAVCRQSAKQGYGSKMIESAERICQERKIQCLRLNCGTLRHRLRNFYESNGFKAVDRVFIDNRDQIRYEKFLNQSEQV